jgi:hypothetical protein
MTDIFFSYSSVDRERVRPIHDALVAQGFEVFWDQQVPTGMDWDSWIRQHLTKSKCAIAFWSTASVASDNVRHEATVAKQQGKLISVLLESLTAQQFPMGLYAQQAANLSSWDGDQGHDAWRKFRREYEAKLTPLWVRRQIDELEAELVGERARREGAERRDRVLQAQIAKEAEMQQELKRERDSALDEVAALKATVEDLTRSRSEAEAQAAETQQELKRERDRALEEVTALKASIEEWTRAWSDAEANRVDSQLALKRDRDEARGELAALRATVDELTQARSDAEAKEAEAQQALTRLARERGHALDEVAALMTKLKELMRARLEAGAKQAQTAPVEKPECDQVVAPTTAEELQTITSAAKQFWSSNAVWLRAAGICAVGLFLSLAEQSLWPLIVAVLIAVGLEFAIRQEKKDKQTRTGHADS